MDAASNNHKLLGPDFALPTMLYDQDMEMRCLQFGEEALEKPHSSEYIAQQIREMCMEHPRRESHHFCV